MEDIISKIIDIKNEEDIIPLPCINISIKNENENMLSFQVTEYQTDNNIHIINLYKLDVIFFVNDILQIKCNFNEDIKIYCINPFLKNIMNNNEWNLIGITEQKNDQNLIILKVIINDCKHILYITFNTIQKNMLSNLGNRPVEISFYMEYNNQTRNFVNNFSNNMSEILNIPENKIITLKIKKKILIFCHFIILSLDNTFTTSQLINQLLYLINVGKKVKYYKNNKIIQITDNYEIIINNLVTLERILFYSDNRMFHGIQIQSGKKEIYKNNMIINDIKKKNIINIDEQDKEIEILIQIKNKDHKINYYSDIDNIIINDNIICIKTIKSFYIDIIITENINDIFCEQDSIKMETCEINKISIFFNMVTKKDIKELTLYKLLTNKEKIKTFIITIIVGFVSGILYFKIKNEEYNNKKNEEFVFFSLQDENINMDKKIFKKEVNKLKYKKYNLKDDFFN